MKVAVGALSLVVLVAFTPVQRGTSPSVAATIPLCPGLTIVTAVAQPTGDYESIKTIQSVTDSAVQVKYSSEGMVQDLTDDQPHLVQTNVTRTIRRSDLRDATLYMQVFSPDVPEVSPMRVLVPEGAWNGNPLFLTVIVSCVSSHEMPSVTCVAFPCLIALLTASCAIL